MSQYPLLTYNRPSTTWQPVWVEVWSASRVRKEKMDVARARERADAVRGKLAELDRKLADDIDAIEARTAPGAIELETVGIKARSADITLELFGLAWMPYRLRADGRLAPDWR